MKTFFRQLQSEMKHVVWLNTQEALWYTVLVIVISLIVAIYVGALDYGFSELLKKIIS